MKIAIWYKSAVRESNIVDNTKAADKVTMGKLNDTSAQLFCIASFLLSSKPNKLQLDTLIKETTALIDRGYYGDDGWFVDIGENSYYIDLVDHDLVGSQPYLVDVTPSV